MNVKHPLRPLALALCLAPLAPQAAEKWSGEGELGLVSTSGNTDTTTLNLKAKASQVVNGWKNTAKVEVLNAKNAGATSAERYAGSFQTRRKVGETGYVFGLVDGSHDRFGGIPYLLSESVGYGRGLYQGARLTIDGEAGLGARHAKPRGEDTQTDAVLRLSGSGAYALSDTAKLSEDLSVETGANNTISKSVTALTAKVMNDLSMKLSFTVLNISDVPAGSKNTDTETAVTLVYSF